MNKRDQLVVEANRWIGTPFHWQAAVCGAGCDCKGLIFGVARNCEMPEAKHPFFGKHDYGPVVDENFLRMAIAHIFKPTANPAPGDICLMVMMGKAQHLGIMVSPIRIIETYQRGPGRVIETTIGPQRKIESWWTWPSLLGE